MVTILFYVIRWTMQCNIIYNMVSFFAPFEKVWSGTLRKVRNKTIIILVETKLIILLNIEHRST